ncbi:MAG: ImmA/IrrE family metallo-endopeptidase [Solirubrobacteraceae bacterium]
MKPTYVPVTPAVLQWAMEESAVDPPELAERAKTEPSTVLGWLNGEEQPTKTQFRAIAAMLKRPAAFFMMASPPIETAVPPAFRHPPGHPEHESTRAELDAVATASRVRRIARWTAERVADRRWLDEPVPAVTSDTPPARAAEMATSWLAWSTTEQRGAANPSAVVKIVRGRLEERGVLALQLPIGEELCRGFSLNDDVKPLVAINSAYIPAARLFTYVHELGHLMRRSDSICLGFGDTGVERWCEQFAAALLMPHEHLRTRIAARFGTGATITDLEQVRLLAGDFNVSLTATAIRLEDLNCGTALVSQIPRTSDHKKSGGGRGSDSTRGAVRARELGEGYISLMLAGARDGALGRQDLLRYLDVSEGQLRSTGIGPLER